MTGNYEIIVGTRDVDGGHVDNTIVPAYVGEARRHFLRETVDFEEGYGIPVVHLELDFQEELFPGDRIVASTSVREVGSTSFTTETELQVRDNLATTATTVQVVTDPDTGDPTSVPPSWRDAFDVESSSGSY
ncbi:MAG: acyl-CoA thioesterase [Natronomonas sp.]